MFLSWANPRETQTMARSLRKRGYVNPILLEIDLRRNDVAR